MRISTSVKTPNLVRQYTVHEWFKGADTYYCVTFRVRLRNFYRCSWRQTYRYRVFPASVMTTWLSIVLATIIQQDATNFSLFKSVNCSTCIGWYFTYHQQLVTLYLQCVALLRPLLLPTVNVTGPVQSRSR